MKNGTAISEKELQASNMRWIRISIFAGPRPTNTVTPAAVAMANATGTPMTSSSMNTPNSIGPISASPPSR